MLDVDKFKAVNDRYGHPAGDQVLQAVGQDPAESAARAQDLAARYGGEEMVAGAARHAAAPPRPPSPKASAAPSQPSRFTCSGITALPMTVSIGVAAIEPGSPLHRPST